MIRIPALGPEGVELELTGADDDAGEEEACPPPLATSSSAFL